MAPKIIFAEKARIFLTLGLLFSGFALTALAQEGAKATESSKWKKKPTLTFKFGSFFPQVATQVSVDGGTDIDVEEDLGLEKSATVLRLDGDIRLKSWFSVNLSYYGFGRSKDNVINKDIQVGDTIFPVHQTLKTSLNTSYANVDLKFYILHRPRLDFGVYAGIYLAHYKMRLEAVELDKKLLEIRKVWAPVPSIGLHFSYTLIPNMYLYAKAGYFKLSPTKRTKFDSSILSINLDYFFYKFLGVGARYEYSRFDLDLDVASYHGNIKYDLNGAQVYLTLGF